MPVIKKGNLFKGFGFNIFSEIDMPELPPINLENEMVDIEVKIIENRNLQFEKMKPYEFSVKGNSVIFNAPDIAFFTISNGKEIVVSPINQPQYDLLRLYILGTCMGILLMQKRILPLHGSAIEINGKAYAFVGDSGIGKSTLASVFIKKGYKLITDDVVAVTFTDNDRPYVIPAYPQQKLWKESLDEFGIETSKYRPIYQRETKFAIPVQQNFTFHNLPLGGIFELIKVDDSTIELSRIEKFQSLKTLFLHTYRNFLIPQLGLMDWHFNCSTKIINDSEVCQIKRSNSGFTAYDIASLILSSIK